MEQSIKMPAVYTEISDKEMLGIQGGNIILTMSAKTVQALQVLRSNEIKRYIAFQKIAAYICKQLDLKINNAAGIFVFNHMVNTVIPSLIERPNHSITINSKIKAKIHISDALI